MTVKTFKMKKLYFLLAVFLVGITGNSQIVTITDANLKAKLLAASPANTTAKDLSGNYFKIDADNDGEIQVSEALQVKELNLLLSGSIASLEGINSFTNITKLQHSYGWGSGLNIVDLTGLIQLNYLEIRCNNLNLGQKDNLETLLLWIYAIPLTYQSQTATLKNFKGHINTFLSINYTKRTSLQDIKLYGNNSGNSILQYTELKYLTNLTSLDLGISMDANGDGINLAFQNYNPLDNPVYPQNIKNLVIPQLFAGMPLQNFHNLESLKFRSIATSANGVECSCPVQAFNPANFPFLKKLVFWRYFNNITHLDLTVLPLLESFETKETFVYSAYPGSQFTIDFGNNLNLNEVIIANMPTTSFDFTGNPNLKTIKFPVGDFYYPTSGNVTINLAPNSLLETLRIDDNSQSVGSFDNNLNFTITNLETSNNLKSIYLVGCNFASPFEINSLGLTSFYAYNSYFNAVNLGFVPSMTLFDLSVGDPYIANAFLTDFSLDLSGAPNVTSIDILYQKLRYLSLKNGKQDTNVSIQNDNMGLTICADAVDCPSPICFFDVPENCIFTNYCTLTPNGTFNTISGNIRFDRDLNGCSLTDIPSSFLQIKSYLGANATMTFSDTDGDYLQYLGLGNYTTTTVFENPTYFTASPASFASNFTTFDTVQNQDICVTPNGTFNDLDVTIIPISNARPGFNARYKVLLRNKGTTTLSGNLVFNFDSAKMNFVSSSLIPSSVTTGTINWNFNLLPLTKTESTVIFTINPPTGSNPVNGGDLLVFNATISTTFTDQTANDNTFVLNQTVINAVDPNDKTCLEGLTITPDKIGNYVNYVIRFENTGTANATTVVVKDIINTARFDINSIVPLDSSHTFRMTVTNSNQLEFYFENINLPFDDANNDGYIAFKIKTKPTLVVGNSFSNTANIYFDYNAPIPTNTATTLIQILGTQDFEFGTYFTVYPNPASTVLNLETKATIGVKSITIYNLLGQMVTAIPNADSVSSIDVANLKSGTYFIKMNTDKGTAIGKFVKE